LQRSGKNLWGRGVSFVFVRFCRCFSQNTAVVYFFFLRLVSESANPGYGEPCSQALRLFRVLIARSRSFAVTAVEKFAIMDSIMAYISMRSVLIYINHFFRVETSFLRFLWLILCGLNQSVPPPLQHFLEVDEWLTFIESILQEIIKKCEYTFS